MNIILNNFLLRCTNEKVSMAAFVEKILVPNYLRKSQPVMEQCITAIELPLVYKVFLKSSYAHC